MKRVFEKLKSAAFWIWDDWDHLAILVCLVFLIALGSGWKPSFLIAAVCAVLVALAAIADWFDETKRQKSRIVLWLFCVGVCFYSIAPESPVQKTDKTERAVTAVSSLAKRASSAASVGIANIIPLAAASVKQMPVTSNTSVSQVTSAAKAELYLWYAPSYGRGVICDKAGKALWLLSMQLPYRPYLPSVQNPVNGWLGDLNRKYKDIRGEWIKEDFPFRASYDKIRHDYDHYLDQPKPEINSY